MPRKPPGVIFELARVLCVHCVACYAVVSSYALAGLWMRGRVPPGSMRDAAQVVAAPVWFPVLLADRMTRGEWVTMLYPPSAVQYVYPLAVYLAIAAPPLLLMGARARRRRLRCRAGQCLRCGYDLTGNVSGVCPECGRPAVRDGT